jgi:hypothetical protein
MDSKNIFISYQHYFKAIEWERHGESEWIYVGTGEEFNDEKAGELIRTFFEESELYLITDRHNSCHIEKGLATAKIKKFMVPAPALANKDFSKIMEFIGIGIVRKGQRST